MIRGLRAGFAGSTTMAGFLAVHTLLRDPAARPVDYDGSRYVVDAASTLLRVRPARRWTRAGLFVLVHWGYGSVMGEVHERARSRVGAVPAALGLWGGTQALALALFPVLGGTPPPWRWRRDRLASSVTGHVVYTATVAAVSARTAPRRGRGRPAPRRP